MQRDVVYSCDWCLLVAGEPALGCTMGRKCAEVGSCCARVDLPGICTCFSAPYIFKTSVFCSSFNAFEGESLTVSQAAVAQEVEQIVLVIGRSLVQFSGFPQLHVEVNP